jgi:hypothetical protein
VAVHIGKIFLKNNLEIDAVFRMRHHLTQQFHISEWKKESVYTCAKICITLSTAAVQVILLFNNGDTLDGISFTHTRTVIFSEDV